ncbi:MAG: DUF3014 domain-containing protein [Victivallales bacterium]|nr:DUF3014 domain-containing protein [Victivallales bacterium]
MKTTTKVLIALPPIIILCLAIYFWDYLSSPGKSSPQETPQGITTPESSTATDNPVQENSQEESRQKTDETSGNTATAVQAETIPLTDGSSENTPTKPKGYELLKALADSISDNQLWLSFAHHPAALEVFVKATEQLANGNRPLVLSTLDFIPKPQPFKAIPMNGVYIIAPETEQRFSAVVQAITSIPPEKAANLLSRLEPDLEAILHDKFGYPPEISFKKIYLEALTTILTTPIPEKPLQLVRLTDTLYKYANSELEELTDAQKFILRLGIANQTALIDYARELWKNQ